MKIYIHWWEKIVGLMFKKEKQSVLFISKKPKKVKLHTWFVRYPIDIFFIDEDLYVTEFFENVKPFRSGIKSKFAVPYVYEKPYGIGYNWSLLDAFDNSGRTD